MNSEPLTIEGLPANIDAERTLLGACLLENQILQDILTGLQPDDFSLDSHRSIVRAMKALSDRGETIDIITLANLLSTQKQIEAVGGVAYLASLTEGLPLRPQVEDYIRIVRDKGLLRRIMVTCTNAISRAADQSESGLEVLTDLAGHIEALAEPTKSTTQGPVKVFIADVAARDNEEYTSRKARTIPTGNAWLDTKMGGGYRMGKYTIVAARPKVGKSGHMVSSVAYNCQRGRKCVVFSLEMEKDELLHNFIPYVVSLSNRTAVRPDLRTPEEHALVQQAWETLLDWPLVIHDGDMDIDQVCWTMDRETRNGEEVLFALDHFGLLGGKGKSAKEIRERYVDNSSRLRRKMLQKKNCALMNLFQLNPVPREVADKRPLPDDLKESKNPLEDCYACILLHRYVDKESLKITKKANINLAMIRGGGGSPGNVDCEFDTRYLRFNADAQLELDDDDFIP